MKDSDNFETLEIKLPKHLAEWLKEYSEMLAMTPSQLLGVLLSSYYEAYKKGTEKQYYLQTKESQGTKTIDLSSLQELAEKFIEEGKVSGGNKTVVRKFAPWAKDKIQSISELNDNTINMFLEEYIRENGINEKTKNLYKGSLRKFIDYVLQATKDS